jgi:NAD kinase
VRHVVVSAACFAYAVSIKGSYLVDPASSHMLVSKIKPCMSKYKLLIL